MLTLSEHQTIQPVLVGVYMARALVLVVFVSNYVVVLFSFDIVTKISEVHQSWKTFKI
jgi:hypothetical protein